MALQEQILFLNQRPLWLWIVSFLNPSLSQQIDPLPDLSQTRNLSGLFACHQVPPILTTSPPPDYNFTVSQSKSIFISLKPDPKNTSPDSPGTFFPYVPTLIGIDCSSLSLSKFSWWKACAETLVSLHLGTMRHQSRVCFPLFFRGLFWRRPCSQHCRVWSHFLFYPWHPGVPGETSTKEK